MGIRVVMELDGDNDISHERRLEEACKFLEAQPGGTKVRRCVITTGTVKIEEAFEGNQDSRKQRIVR